MPARRMPIGNAASAASAAQDAAARSGVGSPPPSSIA
jgi:hypothetical protein